MSEQSEGTPPLPEGYFPEIAAQLNSVDANSTEFVGTVASERESASGGEGVNSMNVESSSPANYTFEDHDATETSVSEQKDADNEVRIDVHSECNERDWNITRDDSHDDIYNYSLHMMNQYNAEPSRQDSNIAFNEENTLDSLDIDNASLFVGACMVAPIGELDDLEGIHFSPLSLHASARREISSDDPYHRTSALPSGQGHNRLQSPVERPALASTELPGDDDYATIIQGMSNTAAGACSDGISSDVSVSTVTDHVPRTITERYHDTGRGPQLCNKCGAPRKLHRCPFKVWNNEECKKIRIVWLAASFYAYFQTVGAQESEALSNRPVSTESLEPSQEHADLIEQPDVVGIPGSRTEHESQSNGDGSDTVAIDPNETNQETRTITKRYNMKGRAPYYCSLCGKLREKHLCTFEWTPQASKEEFIKEKIFEALAIGLCLFERLYSILREGRHDDNENQTEVRESEVCGQESQDEMETSDSEKKKRRKKK